MIDAIQLLYVIGILGSAILAGWRLAPYIVRVYSRAPGRLDRFFNPIENAIYRLTGVNTSHTMGWKEYFFAALFVNFVQMVIAFTILTYQNILPLNPMHFGGLSWSLAFNTAISIATNTNLQHYNGEYQLSYLSQMTAIQFLQFTSAATGICVAVAFTRGLTSGLEAHGELLRRLRAGRSPGSSSRSAWSPRSSSSGWASRRPSAATSTRRPSRAS